jgi:hypothetical protein
MLRKKRLHYCAAQTGTTVGRSAEAVSGQGHGFYPPASVELAGRSGEEAEGTQGVVANRREQIC